MKAIRHPTLKSFLSDKAPSATSFLILFQSVLPHLSFNVSCQKQSLLLCISVTVANSPEEKIFRLKPQEGEGGGVRARSRVTVSTGRSWVLTSGGRVALAWSRQLSLAPSAPAASGCGAGFAHGAASPGQ